MSYNFYKEPLPDIGYAAGQQAEDLVTGVFHQQLECTISGELTVAGGAVSGDLMTEGLLRLIDEISIVWDGYDLVAPISPRLLAAISRRMVAQAPSGQNIATADAQVATPFSVSFIVPFQRNYLANPFDTVLPPLNVRQQFRMYVRWNRDKSNAASDAGTGAIITGGDRVVSFASAPTLRVVQTYARDGVAPWFIPIIRVIDSDQFSAANPRLPLPLRGNLRFDSVLLAQYQGANEDPADLIDTMSFTATGSRYLNAVRAAHLHEFEQYRFPAVGDVSDVGYLWVPFADGGKLGNVVNPKALGNPQFEFSVDAPGSAPGVIRMVSMELMTSPGATRVQQD